MFTREQMIEAIRRAAAGEDPEEVLDSIEESEEEQEAYYDGLASLKAGDQDWDSDRWAEMNGYGEYDLNQGIRYNDGGEPIGYC